MTLKMAVRRELERLQAQLIQDELWQSEPVPAQALASTQPFAVDTLRFEQWLQFIYLPRLFALLDAGAALPTKVAVAPMAQESLAGHGEVIALLSKLDSLMSEADDA
ncbi:YqcC family protein [Ferrimonas futtsuensis]|uniref:YqcC family protein n=1 Tax=Ferrimonas futtsuensis TaxID=364764 RepID=UPI000429D15F|nr:YqcC family protein [Ferrimonas futtsuensis]